MTEFRILPARPHHCGKMLRRLRRDQCSAMAKLGIKDGHHKLRDMFDASGYARAWTIDGRLAGLGGVHGPELSTEGFIWLALSEEAMAHPVAVVRAAQRQISDIMTTKRKLTTTVYLADEKAFHFARFLGFRVVADMSNPHEVLMTYEGAR